jgi:4-amino-4-deoxy-L-arabinose transferase-like glycosyltransferase
LFAAGFLIAIHPLFIFHHRYVWNPSLVTPFLIAALIGLIKLFQENRPRWIWLIATGLSLAVSLSYSVAPQALLIFGMAMFKAKNKKLMLLAQVSTAVFFNLPTLFFELRHNFLLTKSVLYPEYLQGDSLGWNRVYLLFTHLISPRHPELIGGLSLALLVLCLVSWGIHRKYPPQNQMRSASFTLMLVLFWASVVITSVIPLTLHEHYMFGLATLLVMTLAFLPWQVLVPTLGVICILWMTPFYWQLYTKAPLHTVAEKQNCMAQVCQQIAGPVFINTHSSSHNHQALEYIFLLKEAGCTALSTTEFQPSSASQMVVVADNAEYTHGQTGYYELSQFGGGTQTKVVECKPNLKAYFIAK